ncbi:MAG: ATP-dependent dethiobiotin synthetase BioD [Muribaculaceae bacterium]|nr:ATP-dependent dethiobiotin synthetase BioD [Muribaculaceae bacterium]
MSNIIFVSGIDTDAGKSYVTGVVARQLMEAGHRVITQKFIQTGNAGYSEDINLHRLIMGTGMLPEDSRGLTAPIIFPFPASAQLAARLAGREIDLELIDRSTAALAERYDYVLIEGAGGLMVPITDTFTTIDYVASRHLPVMLVTNGRLGSINHTLLSLNALSAHGIKIHSVAYNEHFDDEPTIAADTRAFLKRYLDRNHPQTPLTFIPSIRLSD